MATKLHLPTGIAPTNLHLRDTVSVRFVENDIYDIAKRMQEVSSRLYAIEAEEHGRVAWIIMEHCEDGVDRLVFRTPHFDGRVIAKLKYLMSVDLHTRLDIIEREEYRFEEARKEAELDELYEKIGRPMWTDLEKTGFITRPVSYPKSGVTGGKGSLKRAE
ncbi:MAG: hypothetical protein ACXVGB_00665 [Mycobacteriaceae bacterium]